MPSRPQPTRPPLLVLVSLALVVAVLTPATAAAQDAFVSLYEGREILVFDPANAADVSNRVSLLGRPTGLVVTPDGLTVYVITDATVRIIAWNPSTSAWEVQLGDSNEAWLNGEPEQIALSPNGQTLWIPNMSSQIWYTNIGSFATSNRFFVPGNARAFGIAMVTTPAGLDRAYVSLPDNNVVLVYDASVAPTASTSPIATIALGNDAAGAPVSGPRGVAASPHGDRVYIASTSGHVSVIDTDETVASRVITTVTVGDSPQNLVVSANGTEVYATLPNSGALATIETTTYTFGSLAINVDTTPSNDAVHGVGLNDAGFRVIAHSGTHMVTSIDSAWAISPSPLIPPSVPWTTTRPRYVAFKPVTPVAPPNDPPYFDPATACDFTHTAEVDKPLTFNIIARDDGAFTLGMLGTLPAGASMSPDLPFAADDTANSTFVWNPTVDDVGLHELTYVADDGVNPTVSCAVSINVPSPPPPPPPPGGEDTAFAAFKLHYAKIGTRGRFADSFRFSGRFSVDLEEGDGIHLPDEEATVSIEGVEFAIPSGAFRSYGRGRLFKYRGTQGDTKLLVYVIRRGRSDSGKYLVHASGWKANLDGAENPLQMCVAIGDDFGCAERNGRIR